MNGRRLAKKIKALAPYIAAATILLFSVSSWIPASNTPSAAPASGESYLYNTEDAYPVLDHGLAGSDFLKSASSKVVEFYDPKCGVCQAFKYNYIEVAKKVRAQKPRVEFYGVSCEVHPDLCSGYGESTVPKIFAFPGAESGPEGGIDVPKGAGDIYFLSSRLMKALRTPEEIAAGGKRLSLAANGPKRRLFEEFGSAKKEYEGSEDAIS